MSNGIRIGKLFDIEIVLDYSWVLIFSLITWSLAQHYLMVHADWSAALRWSLALVTSLLFFASVLAHELAHSLVSKAQGIPVPRISLFIFGGASQISEEPRRAVDEFDAALAHDDIVGRAEPDAFNRIGPDQVFADLNYLAGKECRHTRIQRVPKIG